MDESIDEFKENFKRIQEKKQLKLAQISKFLSPNVPHPSASKTTASTSDNANSSTNTPSSSSKSPKLVNTKISLHKLNESVQLKLEKTKKSDSKQTISRYFSNSSSISSQEEFKCPICSNDLTNLNESDREKHVNQCLDKDYSNFKFKPTNKFVKNKSVESETEQVDKQTPEPCTSKQASTSTNKDEKSNVDFESKQKKLNESLLKDAVPNCPICGKVLHTFNIRQNHLKKCSQVFHIKTESLVELVRKQQEKIEREIARGLVPSDVYFIKQKNTEDKPKKNKITNRVIKLEQPNSKQEEQLQIAIALSNSINPAEDCPKQAEIKLFKGNKKTISVESTALLIDDETRTSILSKRFSTIIENQIKYTQVDFNCERNRFSKTKFKPDKNFLWDKCKYFKETAESFYVKIFLETGRFTIGHQVFIEKTDEQKFANIEVINTQTAFLLADLNDQTQENISIYLTQQNRLNQTQFSQAHITLNSIREDQESFNHSQLQQNSFNQSQLFQTNLIEDKEKEEHSSINLEQEEFHSNNLDENNYHENVEKSLDSLHEDNQDIEIDQIENSILPNCQNPDQSQQDILNESNKDQTNKTSDSVKENNQLNLTQQDNLSNNSYNQEKGSNQTNNNISDLNEDQNMSIDKSPRKGTVSSKNLFMNESDDSNDKCIQISDDDVQSLNENSRDENNQCVFIDETQLSSSPLCEKNITTVDDDLSNKSSSNSNILDQNLDILDETNSIEENILEKTSRKSTETINKSNEEQDEILINDDEPNENLNQTKTNKFELVNNLISKKRKSVDIIELDDNEDDSFEILETNSVKDKEDNNKKFKIDLDVIEDKEDDSNESASTLPSLSEKEEKNDFNKMDDVEHEPEKFSKSQNQDQDYLNEREILSLLEKTEREETQNQIHNNEDANDPLDEVWQNFGENQFDDFGDVNYNCDNFQFDQVEIIENFEKDGDIQELQVETKKKKSDCFLEPKINFEVKNSDYTDKKDEIDNDDDDDDDDINDFIRNYREKEVEPNKKNESQNSLNSTLDDPSLDNLSEKNPTPVIQNKKPKPTKQNKQAEPIIPKPLNIQIPDFTSMGTPDLKTELKKFGVKALPKKQAIRKLVEIYEYTNRKEKSSFPRSQSCINLKTSINTLKPSSSTTSLSKAVYSTNDKNDDEDEDIDAMAKIMNLENSDKSNKNKPKKKTIKKTVSDLNIVTKSHQETNTQESSSGGFVKIGLKNTTKKAASTKSKKDIQECTLDERMLEMAEDDEDEDCSESSESSGMTLTQKQKNPKIPKEKKTLNEEETKNMVFDLIKWDDNLYLSVLNYEPIDYEKFFTSLQTSLAPRKVNNKILMKVLDEFCITFTLKNLNTRGPAASKVKSKKKH